MPHFTIEYSANLDARVDMAEIVELVRKAAVETGIFPLGGIRVRAVKCEHYAIADGNPQHGFLAMVLRLGEGRDLAARKKAGGHIFKALSGHLDVFGIRDPDSGVVRLTEEDYSQGAFRRGATCFEYHSGQASIIVLGVRKADFSRVLDKLKPPRGDPLSTAPG